MDLSIVIVSWNVREKLRDNLTSLYQSQGDFSFEAIVVDNASGDKTAEMIEKEFPQVKLIKNDKNLGFSKANNQAFALAQGKYILLLNPDMRVNPDTLKNMLIWMDANRQATVASCLLVDEKNQTINGHVRYFPGFIDQFGVASKLRHLFPSISEKYLRKDFDYSQAQKVDTVRGAFFMISRANLEQLQIPLELDEKYFIWFEEVDFCKQISKKGGEVWYAPSARCLDYVGASFKQVKSFQKQKYFRDSMLIYFKKWHPAWQYWTLKIVWMPIILLTKIKK